MYYIVTGGARVGGHLLTGIIRQSGEKAYHTHQHDLQDIKKHFHLEVGQSIPYHEICLIINNRYNVFNAVMSNLVAKKINQWSHNYKVKHVEPFAVEEEELLYNMQAHHEYYTKYDLTLPWAKVEYFYFEDYVADHDHVRTRLRLCNVPKVLSKNRRLAHVNQMMVKAPYNYRNIITNWKDLHSKYFA